MTKRERQVVALLCEGHNNPSIASQMGISLEGAKHHVRNVMGKMCCNNRVEVVIKALTTRHNAQLAAIRNEYCFFDTQSN